MTETASVRFDKRRYDLPTFFRHSWELLRRPRQVRRALRSGQVDRKFAERLMLAVTQVNQCRYCSYAHSRMALQAGLSADELAALLEGDLGAAPTGQRPALVFAQQFAANREQVDPADWERLQQIYGPEAAEDIVTILRVITMGNLLGNSLDAVLWRLRGGK